jgi:hypothetical protein
MFYNDYFKPQILLLMKTFLLTVLILTCSTFLFGQKYVAFPTANAEWNEKFSSNPYEIPQQVETVMLRYSLHGDTLVNGISYKKLCLNVGSQLNPVYVGIGDLREQDKKIFYIGSGYTQTVSMLKQQVMQHIRSCLPTKSTDSHELLLYDFNVKVGDTVQWGYSYNIISKIDSIRIGNSFRKCYRFSTGNDFVLEGIGSVVNGLLGSVTQLPMCGNYYMSWNHVCFSQNGETQYLNPEFKDCNSLELSDTKSYFGENACWSYKATEYYYQYGGIFITQGRSASLGGDTLINNIKYKKFYGVDRFAAVRQVGQKVYVKTNDQTNEFLLYDFSVKAGDTIFSTSAQGELSRRPIVSHVDSVTMYNGERRKRIYVGGDVWIEGIGSISDFLHATREYVTCDCNSSYQLISFAREEHVRFYNSELCKAYSSCSGVIDDVKIVSGDENSLSIFPNPVSDWLSVKFVDNIVDCSITLFDVQGRSVLQKQLNSFQNTVSVGSLSNGLYMYRLTNNGRLLKTGKVVKI